MTETQLQERIIGLCEWLHLLCYHVGRSDRGLVSAKGFPDLVIAGPFGTIFAELKNDKSKPTAEQIGWLTTLSRSQEHVYLWRPKDWPQIEQMLRKVAGR